MENDEDEGFHNPDNPRRPIVYYHDINGDIVLDGRMQYTETFDVNYPRNWRYGSKAYLEVCLGTTHSEVMCDQDSGLIVCWAKQDESVDVPHPPSHPDARINNVLKTYTVWNNTYLFDIPESKKCFNVFLFGFQHYPGTYKQLRKEKSENWRRKRDSGPRWTSENRMEASLSKYIESPDGLPVEASLDANNRIKNSTGGSVRLADQEIQMWARTNKYLFTVPFLASGSGPCCNLKAKLMGREPGKDDETTENQEKYGPKLNLTIDNLAQLVMGPVGQPILSRIKTDFSKTKMYGYMIDYLRLEVLDPEKPEPQTNYNKPLAPEFNVPYEFRQLVYVCFEAEVKTGVVSISLIT
uniref:Uncharacterized protein n=1 Tax=Ditylenchus dipsaci TaxID=166011 RepID=A0A915E194_9BILA